MNILKKIGTPFVAIWRWIKETAWVQPLLIVGIIFAIIFSIPSIVNWVSSWNLGDDTYTWLYNGQLSLEGVTDNETKGEAATFFEKFNEANVAWGNGNKEEARTALKDYVGDTNKMFLYFVKENEASANINDASNYLVNNAWNEKVVERAKREYGDTDYVKYTSGSFKYKTIFVDQVIDVDDDDHTYDQINAYEYFTYSSQFEQFYSALNGSSETTQYYRNIVNGKLSDLSLESYRSSISKFSDKSDYSNSIPALVMIDLTDVNTSTNIITNTVFTFDGSNQYTRADFLANCWIGVDEFGSNL